MNRMSKVDMAALSVCFLVAWGILFLLFLILTEPQEFPSPQPKEKTILEEPGRTKVPTFQSSNPRPEGLLAEAFLL